MHGKHVDACLWSLLGSFPPSGSCIVFLVSLLQHVHVDCRTHDDKELVMSSIRWRWDTERKRRRREKRLSVIFLCLLSSEVVFGDRTVLCFVCVGYKPGEISVCEKWRKEEGLENRNLFIFQTSQQMLFFFSVSVVSFTSCQTGSGLQCRAPWYI